MNDLYLNIGHSQTNIKSIKLIIDSNIILNDLDFWYQKTNNYLDTFEKTFQAVDWLCKKNAAIMVSSGLVTKEFVSEYSEKIKVMKFVPKHQNNLSNQFSLQCNFDADAHLA